jgi:hypothetical protein
MYWGFIYCYEIPISEVYNTRNAKLITFIYLSSAAYFLAVCVKYIPEPHSAGIIGLYPRILVSVTGWIIYYLKF